MVVFIEQKKKKEKDFFCYYTGVCSPLYHACLHIMDSVIVMQTKKRYPVGYGNWLYR